ncbi:MAG: alkaline phosphatase family protein, partial [Aeromicrobium sp.]
MPKLRIADFVRMTMAWAINALALIAAAAVLPGLNADSKWRFVVVAAVTGVFGVVVRPVLATLAAHVGWILIVVVAVAGQAVTMHLALLVVPGVTANSFWTLVAATWIAATISTILTWLATAGTDESFDSALLRFAGKGAVLEDPDVDGIVFVQFDGVPFPVAQWALNSGSMPTIRRWVDQGSHRLDEWTAQLPCTTPASQLGILHGTCARVPAFRWYDRELGRVLVANRPEDAAVIEKRATNGKGLLADRGVSVSNLFSGDAEKCMMTMSRVSVGRGTLDTRRTFARFVVRPDGLARSVARTIAEVASERFQARRQRRRDVLPRVQRSWTYAFLRASSNGVLHDLNTALVSQEMFRGARSIYVDFVDYDEVAHHAGVNRVESLRVLETLDQTLSTLERIAGHAPRHYHFVVLSDHGQSQGTPFEERHGASLSGVCAKLAGESVSSEEENVESWGRAGSVLDDLGGEEEFGGKAATNAASRIHERTAQTAKGSPEKDLVVLGSGNLGLVYVQSTTRLMLEDLETRWPRLVTGLAGLSFGLGWIGCFLPFYRAGILAIHWERLRPAMIFLLLAGFATLVVSLLRRSNILHQEPKLSSTYKSSLILFLPCALLLGIMLSTGFGVSAAEDYWYGAGVPILITQLTTAILAGVLFFQAEKNRTSTRFDLIVVLLMYVVTAVLWAREPLQKSFLFIGPYAPNRDLYPFADAALYDTASRFA